MRAPCLDSGACETYGALGVDVADISSNAGGATDIEERELSDARVELEEEGQRLADSTAGTEDGNLGELYSKSNVSGRASGYFQWSLLLGIEFTYVAGRGGEGAALDSADDGLGDLTGGEHLVYGRCVGGISERVELMEVESEESCPAHSCKSVAVAESGRALGYAQTAQPRDDCTCTCYISPLAQVRYAMCTTCMGKCMCGFAIFRSDDGVYPDGLTLSIDYGYSASIVHIHTIYCTLPSAAAELR
jgi:hypothetical protein